MEEVTKGKWAFMDRLLLLLVGLVVLASLVDSLPQVLLLLSGHQPRFVALVSGSSNLTFRFLREISLLAVCVGASYFVLSGDFRPNRYLVAFGWFLAAYCAMLGFLTVAYRGLPFILAIVGLRTFQFLPLAFVGFVLAKRNGLSLLQRFSDILIFYLSVQFVLSLLQSFGGFSLHWHKTFFGYRAFGTFAYFNHFGAMLVITSAWMAATHCVTKNPVRRQLYLACLLMNNCMAFLSGSRTAIIVTLMVSLLPSFLSAGRLRLKMAVLAQVPATIIAMLIIVTSPEFTGRQVRLEEEGRIRIWSVVAESLNSAPDLLFGWGLGLGTTTSVTIFGPHAFTGQLGNTHNIYLSILSGYGLIGVTIYAGFLLAPLVLGTELKVVAGPVLASFLLGIPYNVLEVFPANALIMFSIGSCYGFALREKHAT